MLHLFLKVGKKFKKELQSIDFMREKPRYGFPRSAMFHPRGSLERENSTGKKKKFIKGGKTDGTKTGLALRSIRNVGNRLGTVRNGQIPGGESSRKLSKQLSFKL